MKIKIENLNISYTNQDIVKIDLLELNSGDLCLITGSSGTGKTSLLNYLSLNNQYVFDGNYYWDDVLVQDFRVNQIAYVSQNNLLFGEFTVKENLNSFSEMGYGQIENTIINELVNKLDLKKVLEKKAKKLSGGEKQRVAIACSVLKNAALYLFDEPTSMIDLDRKEEVYQLMKSLAEKGKIVVVVSHELEPTLFNKVYEIKNKTISLIKNNQKNVPFFVEKEEKMSLKKLSLKLAQRFFFSQPIVNSMYLLVISICVGLILNIVGFANSCIKVQQTATEVVGSPELQVVNTDTFDYFGGYDEYCAFPINDEDYEAIKNLDHVTYIDRYIYFPLDAYFDEYRNNMITGRMIELANIVLKEDGKEVVSFNYHEYAQGPEGVWHNDYAIFPTYKHQHIEERCSSLIEGDGIYISQEMADKLGIKELTNQVINLYFTVPIGNQPATYEDGITGNVCGRRCMYSALVNMDFPIKGIVSGKSDSYSYMRMFQAHFYLDIEDIKKIQLYYYERYKGDINKLSETEQDFEELGEYYDRMLIDSDIWKSSSAIVQVDDNEYIDEVITEIMNLNPVLSVAVKSKGMNEISNGMTNNVALTAISYSLILYVILLISVSILKYYRRKVRKDDYALLQINGINDQYIQLIEQKEMYFEILVVIIISIITSFFISNIFTFLGYSPYFGTWIAGLFVTLITLTFCLGNLISKKLVRREIYARNKKN